MVSSSDPHSADFTGQPPRRRFASRIGLKRLSQLCHNVGTGLRAGVDIRRIFENESRRGGARHRDHLSAIRDGVAGGETVAASFAQTGGYFPVLVSEMIDVGERMGRLDQIFIRLGEHYDNLLRMRRSFLIAIAWPVFELFLALAIIGAYIALSGWLIPGTPPMTFFGLYGTRGLIIYGTIVGGCVAAVAVLILGVQNGWINMGPLMRALVHVPFIGHGLKTIALSRLTWSLALSTDSDIDPGKAVALAVRTTRNSYYTSRLEGIREVIRRRGEMHEAFEQAGIFPNDFLDALQTGEVSGTISETMQVIAKDYEQRALTYLRLLAVAAGVGVVLLIAGFLIFMIFNMFFQYLRILDDAANF